ncbi:hypothetical protein PMSD_15590 [Paenibacillus macquariensis subsp. defensor]|nr:hypothetical protein PMSD_15590 [Paenibacillus macquariensis subsp. defensor]
MLKYVPVIRYRKEERGALLSVNLSNKIMPLLELMKEKPTSATGTFQNNYLRDFQNFTNPFLVDFPLYFKITRSTNVSISSFLQPLKQNPNLRISLFNQLSQNSNLIPVISYDQQVPYTPGSVQIDNALLRVNFSRIGFRIFESNNFNLMISDISSVIQPGDFLIYDIDQLDHAQNSLQHNNYPLILQLKLRLGFTSILVRSAVNNNIIFNQLIDDQVIATADNSLLTNYTNYGFDAFGDFAGIRKDLSIGGGGGGTASPGSIFYSWHNNNYVGYTGRVRQWDELINHIQPTLINSQSWSNYSTLHHQTCPGCSTILNNPTKSIANWKRHTIKHYLHTMEEFL